MWLEPFSDDPCLSRTHGTVPEVVSVKFGAYGRVRKEVSAQRCPSSALALALGQFSRVWSFLEKIEYFPDARAPYGCLCTQKIFFKKNKNFLQPEGHAKKREKKDVRNEEKGYND